MKKAFKVFIVIFCVCVLLGVLLQEKQLSRKELDKLQQLSKAQIKAQAETDAFLKQKRDEYRFDELFGKEAAKRVTD